MIEINDDLRDSILAQWNDVADRATASIKDYRHTVGDYINVPFVANGVPTNTARWNIRKQRFDFITVPVWQGDEIKHVSIELPYEEPLTEEESLCATIKDRISIVIQEELGKNFNPILGQRIANLACDTIDEIVNEHRN